MPFELRPYQAELVTAVRNEVQAGKKKIIMVLSTGAGKTAILFDISKRAVVKGGKVLLIVHRRDLAFQTQEKFREYGLDAGVIMSGVEPDFSQDIQIVSVWTYKRRLELVENNLNKFYVDASLVLIDEAHRSLSPTFTKVLGNYENKVVIGVTATPCLSSGAAMGNVYDSLVDTVPISWLIENNYLTKCVYYGGSSPDMSGVKTVRGDFDIKELGKITDTPTLTGDVITNWLRIAADKQTIVFCVNRKHARNLAIEFEKHNITVAYLDAHSPDEERTEVLKKFNNSEIQVIMNVALFQEFLDAPITDCIVIARSTKSMGLWRQCVGRGLRPYPGKDHLTVIDHGGCTQRLGYIEDPITWHLNGKDLAYKKKIIRIEEKKLLTCDECNFIFTGKKCPECGTEVKNYGKKIATTDEELRQIKGSKAPATMDEKKQFYGMLEYLRRSKGYKKGWSYHKYKEKFKVWPKGMDDVGPILPDKKFNNWIKYQNIKFWKSKKKKEMEIKASIADHEFLQLGGQREPKKTRGNRSETSYNWF